MHSECVNLCQEAHADSSPSVGSGQGGDVVQGLPSDVRTSPPLG